MFRLGRQNKPSKSGERIDFKFSNFQVLKVPKGWDKLFVYIISVETGKTISKSSKAVVQNGTCQWTETLSETIFILQDDSSKELAESLFKLVVAMGSARSGILGEATVNMADYVSSKASVPVSLPLKKCNYGTVLQVKIQCLTPRTKLSVEELKQSKDPNSLKEDQNADDHNVESKSNGSDNSFTRNGGSLSSRAVGTVSHPKEAGSRETSLSGSGSYRSLESAEDSVGSEDLSRRKNLSADSDNLDKRQDSTSSQTSSAHGNYPANDASQSNHSSFSSRVTGSGDDSENHRQQFEQTSPHVIALSSLKNASSSKSLLEAAEDTIEELRAEAKMWERNARKIMLDLDILRNEFSNQSKKHADLEMELLAAQTERDGLKNEVEQLKLTLKESFMQQTSADDSTFQAKGAICITKELEDEIKFQQESNANLALQLKRSQESNIELVSVLQELEETIEKQKVEIENLSVPQLKISDMEQSIEEKLEENRNLLLQLQRLQESENKLQVEVRMLEQALEDKNKEMENEQILNKQRLLDGSTECRRKLSAKEEDIAILEAKIRQSEETRFREIEALKEKMEELECDCNELTNENLELLIKLKELKNNSMTECRSFDSLSSELPAKSFTSFGSEGSELKSQINLMKDDLEKRVVEEHQTSNVFHDLVKQLQTAFYHVKKPWYNISSNPENEFESDLDNFDNLNIVDMTNSKGWADFFLNYFVKLNQLLEIRIVQCEEVLKRGQVEIKVLSDNAAEAQGMLEDSILKENSLYLTIQKLESSKMKLEANLTDLGKEVAGKRPETEKLEADLLLKEKDIDFLQQHQRKLETQISDLRKEKIQLEENIKIVLRESNISSICLDNLQNDLMVLSNSVDSHVSANRIHESKSSNLESAKHELELHLIDLEEENLQLSEHVSSLEAQLRCLTEERDSVHRELENAKSAASSLEDEIRKLGTEMETQTLDLKHDLEDLKICLSEANEECEALKIRNEKLEASAEILAEECNNLQKSNGELRKQKVELHEHCTQLKANLRESRKSFSDCSKQVGALEDNFLLMLKDFASKEKSLTSELDILLQENEKQKEKLILGESLLSQMSVEKSAEVENLQKEIEHLTQQISAIHDERERIVSKTTFEASNLRADNVKLESQLQEVQSKVKLMDDELTSVQTECDLKVQSLMVELAATKESHDIMMADHEKMVKLLVNYRLSEDKLRTALNEFELKFTVSEYERQQLIEETAKLKVHLQEAAHLQDEVLALKNELNLSKTERGKLEAALHSISQDCEKLKAEKISFIDKISGLQNSMSEFEDCKSKRVALEEKVLLMAVDLKAKEAFCAQHSELKNELNQIKKTNKQFQRNIQQLEVEKNDFIKRAQTLEEELNRSKIRSKKTEMVRNTKQHRDNRNKLPIKTDQAQELLTDQQKVKGDNKSSSHDGSPHAVGIDHVERIQLLQSELSEALEANKKYKLELQKLLCEHRNLHGADQKKPIVEAEIVTKERYERTKSSLETELRDLRERYFHMSLKYAEVEAQREDLVMKLKTSKSGKKWF